MENLVYVVYCKSYSDDGFDMVSGVFSTKEKAEEYINTFPESGFGTNRSEFWISIYSLDDPSY